MGSVPSQSEVLLAARRLIDHGVAVHWLKRREKRPAAAAWQIAPVHTYESLKAEYQTGYNLGVRPGEFSKTPFGYLHLIDMDIRKPELAAEAWAVLLKLWPEARKAPYVISGSGGESRHIYLFTPVPLHSMSFGKSKGKESVFDPSKGRDVDKHDWDVGLYGAPLQAVLPPSVHPITGENYVWGREIDWDLLEMGVGPIVSAEMLESWGAREDDLDIDDDDDLTALAKSAPMGLSEEEIDRILGDIPNDDLHHDEYVQVGMALSHEYEGSQIGFEKWCEWARQSDKFDLRTSKTKWKSFKGRKNPVRMATLIKIAGDARLEKMHSDLDDLIDLKDDVGQTDPLSTALTVIPTEVDDLSDLLGPRKSGQDDLLDQSSITPGVYRRSEITYDPEWRSHFHRNEDGELKSTLHNMRLIMRNDPRLRGIIAMNEFTQEIVLAKEPGKKSLKKASPKPIVQLEGRLWQVKDTLNGAHWSDSHGAAVRAIIEAPDRQGGYGIKANQRDLNDAIDIVAQENAFHPVREYLTGLKWDGVNRASSLFVDYVGAPDDAYHREAALMWLLGSVARIFDPGHKFDFVPILEGIQGARKSTFFRIVARDWFSELEGDFANTQQMVEKMQGAWIMEIPELQGFSKAEVTTIKGFISRQADKTRMAYGRRASLFLRQCVFGGSTNEDEYLRDSTGGRRFWPIKCMVAEIDTDRLSAEIDQIWAEVMIIHAQWRVEHGEHSVLPLYMRNAASIDIARGLQESRRQQGTDDVVSARIEEWLSQPIGSELGLDDLDGEEPVYRDVVSLIEIWEQMMDRDMNVYTDRDQQLLSRAMRKVSGWETTGERMRVAKYGRQRVYRKIA